MNTAIELAGVTKRFGDFGAVNGVDLQVPVAQRCALLGPNGAGKTTLLNLISGRLSLSGGAIRVQGEDVSRASTRRRAQLGVGRSFQKTNIFPELSLLDNVRLGLHSRDGWRTAGRTAGATAARGGLQRVTNVRTKKRMIGCGALTSAVHLKRGQRIFPTASKGSLNLPSRSLRSRASCCSTSRPRA